MELCSNTDIGRAIYQLCEQNKRGRITSVPGRYAKADKQTELVYMDATNLYGSAMKEPLPIGEYNCWPDSKCKNMTDAGDLNTQLLDIETKEHRGYIVTVDAHVPEHLHNYFADYPPFPQPRSVQHEETSPHLT
jgi:hypothetical protein